MHKMALYQRLGVSIAAVIDDFVGNVARDKRINTFVAKTAIPRLKRRLIARICQGSGVRCVYRGGRMKAVHKGLGIRNRDFDALVQDLGRNLNKFKVPTREQKELVALHTQMRKDIVDR